MKRITAACCLTICCVTGTSLIALSPYVFAAGNSPMGGSAGTDWEPRVKKTPQQLAVDFFNQGIKYRDKAWQREQNAAETDNEKKRRKQLAKAQQDFKKAIRKYRSAIDQEPRLYQAHGGLGYALRKVGQYQEALAAYDRSLALNADYTEAIEYRGETYLALGRWEDAKHAYMVLFRADRPRADTLMNAMQTWSHAWSNEEGLNSTEASAFRSWIVERVQLGDQSMDLTMQSDKDWSPE